MSIVTFPRAELGKGGMGLDPNDATMGPIMDSLIMTSETETQAFKIDMNSSSQKWISYLISKIMQTTDHMLTVQLLRR